MKRTHPLGLLSAALLAGAMLATLCQCGDDRRADDGPTGDGPTGDGAAADSRPAAAAAPQDPAPSATVLGDRVHVILSGNMHGHLEPCGCASGQLGGLPRRLVYLQEIHRPDLLIEGGNLSGGSDALDLEKAFTAVQVLFGMQPETHYDALGTGPQDLELPLDAWGQLLQAYDAPVLAADLLAGDSPFQPRAFVEKDVRDTKVRVVSLVMSLPEALAQQEPAPLRLLDPAAGWARGLEGAADATLRVLLAHTPPERARKLAAELQPKPDVLVCVHDSVHEPLAEPEYRADVPIVYPGTRGRFVVDFWFGRAAAGGAIPRYDLVPLRGSETKPDAGQDPAVKEMLRQHRVYVAEEGLREKLARQRPTANGHEYVGNATCGSCHQTDYQLWKNSKHGGAWATLERAEKDPTRYGWPVTQYPDCVGCHTVGYGEQTGFLNPTETPELANVGCERCHGPGSAHSKDPLGARMGRVGDGVPSAVCTQCHDFEQSPDFDYMRRWPMIQHGQTKAVRPK